MYNTLLTQYMQKAKPYTSLTNNTPTHCCHNSEQMAIFIVSLHETTSFELQQL